MPRMNICLSFNFLEEGLNHVHLFNFSFDSELTIFTTTIIEVFKMCEFGRDR